MIRPIKIEHHEVRTTLELYGHRHCTGINFIHDVIMIYWILLTKREGRTGTISVRGLASTDLAGLGRYKKDQGPIFSQYGTE